MVNVKSEPEIVAVLMLPNQARNTLPLDGRAITWMRAPDTNELETQPAEEGGARTTEPAAPEVLTDRR